jgi:hypothetical protein
VKLVVGLAPVSLTVDECVSRVVLDESPVLSFAVVVAVDVFAAVTERP